LPEHQLAGLPFESLLGSEASARRPLGWGPYLIESWASGDHIRLRANENYFRAGEGLPAFDLLILRFLGAAGDEALNPERLQNAMLTGMCDLLDQSGGAAFAESGLENLQALDEHGSLSLQLVAGPVWEQADFGLRPASYDDGYQPNIDRLDIFGDPRTRQGIALCIDRERIVREISGGRSSVPVSYLPPEHPLFNPDLPAYAHDPTAGAELLTQAGWIDSDGDLATPRVSSGVINVPDGVQFHFLYSVSGAPRRLEAATILVESLGECGVLVELHSGPAGEIYAPGPDGPVFGRQFDMAQFAWGSDLLPPCRLWTAAQIPGDPNLTNEDGSAIFPYGWGGVNASGYSNPEFDRACRAALEALPGEAGYLESNHQAQAIFSAELPAIPLFFHTRVVVTRPDLCSFTFDPSSSSELWNIEALDYREDCRE
jgi:peptide/nickel transport system substrate-binding protein